MSDPYIGQIMAFAGNFAPRGWSFCDGSLLSIAQNTALFAILGTTYGGDGQTNFALPDLRGRMIAGAGTGPGLGTFVPGQKAGAASVTLTVAQMPQHNHMVLTSDQAASAATSQGNFLPSSSGRGAPNLYSTAPQGAAPTMAPNMIGPAGGSQPVPTQPPYTCINYIIAIQGIFPPRP